MYLAANRLAALPAIIGVRYLDVGHDPLGHLALVDPMIQELRCALDRPGSTSWANRGCLDYV